MPMVADTPDAYQGQAGFEFLKSVPVTWDETRFVAGETGEFIAVARRNGDGWYLGGINNWTTRTIELTFEFLASGSWELELLHDASLNDTQPNTVARQKREIEQATRIRLPLASGGGFVATIRQK